MADGSDSVTSDGTSRAAKLFRDFEDIEFFEIALIVLLTWVSIALVKRVLPIAADHVPNRFRMYLLGAIPIAKLVFLALAIISVVPLVFDVTLQNLLIIGGAASVAIGFAFKDLVSSLAAGVLAVIDKPYRPGDWINLSDHYGEVVDVGLRSTRLRTPDDTIIVVPNAALWTDALGNANDGAPTLMCVVTFHLVPEHDAAQVRTLLDDVVRSSAYLAYDQPILIIAEPTPSGTRYRIKAYPFDMRDQFLFSTDITVRAKSALAANGVREIAAPAVPSMSTSGRGGAP